MRGWFTGPVVAVILVIASWAVLVVRARRLPSGALKDLAGFIPDCVTTIRRLGKTRASHAGRRSPS